MRNIESYSGPPDIWQSEFKGLREFSFSRSFFKRYGPLPRPMGGPPSRGFIQNSEEKYELRLSCGGGLCDGMTFKVSHHLEINFLLEYVDARVLARAADVGEALNKMVDSWLLPK